MANPYKLLVLNQPSFFQRLFKKVPQENAFIEINNLFASRPLKEIKFEAVAEISAKYKVDFRKKFLSKLKELYIRFVKQCYSDNILTDQELEDLNHLKNLLMLNVNEVEELHNQFASEIYKKSLDEVIFDGKVEKTEEKFLDNLQKNLRLPDSIVVKIYNESVQQLMNLQLGKIIIDERISPDEWEEYSTIAKNLNVTINYDEKSKAKLEKFKLYWLIENGVLPVKEVSINLPKDEKCYFSDCADWLENRTVTQRINYGGPTARIKIMKGFYYSAGSIGVQKITSEQIQLIDSGQVYITNKRIIFVGRKKNSNILLSKVLSLNPYSDGVGIEKDSGRSPIIRVTDNADILALILGRVIGDL